MIVDPKRVLSLVIKDLDEDKLWEEVAEVCRPLLLLDANGVNRLRSGVNGKLESVAIEKHYIDKDYRDTFSFFFSKRFVTPDSRCIRLHFFNRALSTGDLVAGGKEVQESYMGYSVLRPTRPNCIGRTLLDPTKVGLKGCYVSTCSESVNLLGLELSATGFPFISQDTDVTVCAQAALWMLIRYFSNRYPIYPEMYPAQIAQSIDGISLGERIAPSKGLIPLQFGEVLSKSRFFPRLYVREAFPDRFDHLLYTYVESGLPVLAFVPGHVVVCVGHRSDFSRKDCLLDGLRFSSCFNCEFLINDDNCYPYQSLRERNQKSQQKAGSRYSLEDITGFAVPLAEKIFITAEQAESRVRYVVHALSTRYAYLTDSGRIFRLFLTSGKSFKKNLRKRGMGNAAVASIYRELPLPHFVWVCEISSVDLFSKTQQVEGEILWDATQNAYEPSGWISLHIPDMFIADVGTTFNRASQRKEFPLESRPYPAYQSNLTSL